MLRTILTSVALRCSSALLRRARSEAEEATRRRVAPHQCIASGSIDGRLQEERRELQLRCELDRGADLHCSCEPYADDGDGECGVTDLLGFVVAR